MLTHLFDSHCHIDFACFDNDREEVLARAYQAGVRQLLIPGTKRHTPRISSSQIAGVKCHYGVGLHPYFIADHQLPDIDWVAAQLQANRQLWVGEIGLDASCPDWHKQVELFDRQLDLAITYQRPLILHHRKSQSDLLELLSPKLAKLPEQKGILHAFTGSAEQANDWISKGFKLGIGGSITYPRAQKTRRAVAQAPLHGLVLETDAPDMPLAGYQGQRNEPARVAQVLACLAELRSMSQAQLSEQLWQTSCQLVQSLAVDASDDNATY